MTVMKISFENFQKVVIGNPGFIFVEVVRNEDGSSNYTLYAASNGIKIMSTYTAKEVQEAINFEERYLNDKTKIIPVEAIEKNEIKLKLVQM